MTFTELDDSPRVFSMKPGSNYSEVLDILYLWANFSQDSWIYLVIALILAAILFQFIVYALSRSHSVQDIVNGFFHSFWDFFQLFVDLAPSSVFDFGSAVVLWTSICVSMLYAIHMILMSTLSTDLTVAIVPPSIDSLQELLYDPQFKEIKPVILRQMNMYSTLSHSRNGTDERVLFERLVATENVSIKAVDKDDPRGSLQTVLGILKEASKGQIAIIENSEFVNMYITHGLCYIDPETMAKLKAAKDIVSQSILSVLISKQTPPSVRRFIEYKLLTSCEGGLLQGAAQTLACPMLEKMASIPTSVNGTICSEKFSGVYRNQLDLPWEPMNLEPFKRLLRMLLGWIAFAGFLLVIEHVYHRMDKRSKVTVIKPKVMVMKPKVMVMKPKVTEVKVTQAEATEGNTIEVIGDAVDFSRYERYRAQARARMAYKRHIQEQILIYREEKKKRFEKRWRR